MEAQRNFIKELLRRGGVKRDVDKFVDDEAMKTYLLAFVHSSVSEEKNYNRLEFVGDTIVNYAVATWIAEVSQPTVENVGALTKIKHYISSNKAIAEFVMRLDYEKFIRFDKPPKEKFEIQDWSKRLSVKEYKKAVADVFEALCGALHNVINERTKSRCGMTVVCNMIWSILDEAKIATDIETVFDAKSRLKELYDRMKWKFGGDTFVEKHLRNDITGVMVYGYPLGDRTVSENNKILLSKAFDRDKKDAAEKAARDALKRLESDYGIIEAPKDKYIQKNV